VSLQNAEIDDAQDFEWSDFSADHSMFKSEMAHDPALFRGQETPRRQLLRVDPGASEGRTREACTEQDADLFARTSIKSEFVDQLEFQITSPNNEPSSTVRITLSSNYLNIPMRSQKALQTWC